MQISVTHLGFSFASCANIEKVTGLFNLSNTSYISNFVPNAKEGTVKLLQTTSVRRAENSSSVSVVLMADFVVDIMIEISQRYPTK